MIDLSELLISVCVCVRLPACVRVRPSRVPAGLPPVLSACVLLFSSSLGEGGAWTGVAASGVSKWPSESELLSPRAAREKRERGGRKNDKESMFQKERKKERKRGNRKGSLGLVFPS